MVACHQGKSSRGTQIGHIRSGNAGGAQLSEDFLQHSVDE
jgi:hypothetical protein